MIRSLLLLVVAAAALAVGCKPFHRQFITDEQGRALILHGVNVSSSAKGDAQRMPWVGVDDVRRLARDWGFNFARFLIFWDALEPEPGQFDQDYLTRIEERLDWFHDAGIYVVLDMHQDVYSSVFCCDGAPLWAVRVDEGDLPYTPLIPWNLNYFTGPVMRAFDNFWDHEGPHGDLQDHYAEAWAQLAARFKDHPAVLGYDIMNEPACGSHVSFFVAIGGDYDPDGTAPRFDAEILKPFYDRMIAAIRAVDPDAWIFYEPRFAGPADGAPSFIPFLDDPRAGENRLVYFPHFYPIVAEQTGSYGGSKSYLDKWAANRRSETTAQDSPLLIGEFGIVDGYAGGVEHLADVMARADEMTSGWAYWAYDKGGGWDLIAADGSEKEKVDALVRTYPQRIAGTPLWYGYEPETRLFTLHFEEKPGVTGPTEIYVPAQRHYPEGWRVISSDPEGAWSSEWDPDREVLSFTADPASKEHSVIIGPDFEGGPAP